METDYSSLHDEAKRRFAAHPTWKMLRHTPWENDAPIIAAELARDAVASAPSYATIGVDSVAACLERVRQLEEQLALTRSGSQGVVTKVSRTALRNAIAGAVAYGDDNLAIALCTYLEPFSEDEEMDDTGSWTQWTSEQCDAILDRITDAALLAAMGGREELIPVPRCQCGRPAIMNGPYTMPCTHVPPPPTTISEERP